MRFSRIIVSHVHKHTTQYLRKLMWKCRQSLLKNVNHYLTLDSGILIKGPSSKITILFFQTTDWFYIYKTSHVNLLVIYMREVQGT